MVTKIPWSGSAVMEAMATGLPVIVSNREFVHHGESGWFCPWGDPVALGTTLSKITALSNDEFVSYGRHARQFAEGHFALDRMPDAAECLYRDALRHCRS